MNIINNPKIKKAIPAYMFNGEESTSLTKYPTNNITDTIVKNKPIVKLRCVKRLNIHWI